MPRVHLKLNLVGKICKLQRSLPERRVACASTVLIKHLIISTGDKENSCTNFIRFREDFGKISASTRRPQPLKYFLLF